MLYLFRRLADLDLNKNVYMLKYHTKFCRFLKLDLFAWDYLCLKWNFIQVQFSYPTPCII